MRLLPNTMARRPLPAEHDLSGIIVDANGTEFSSGDQVFGFISVGGHTTRFKVCFLLHCILQDYRRPHAKVHSHNMPEFPQIIWSFVLRTSLQLKLLASL